MFTEQILQASGEELSEMIRNVHNRGYTTNYHDDVGAALALYEPPFFVVSMFDAPENATVCACAGDYERGVMTDMVWVPVGDLGRNPARATALCRAWLLVATHS